MDLIMVSVQIQYEDLIYSKKYFTYVPTYYLMRLMKIFLKHLLAFMALDITRSHHIRDVGISQPREV